MEFERAARYRDRIAALSAIQGVAGHQPQSVEEADVFAIDEQAGQFCIEVFFFRNFQNWGNRAYFPRADRSLTPDEVLGSFLGAVLRRQARAAARPASRIAIEDAELLADAPCRAGPATGSRSPCRSAASSRNLVDHARATRGGPGPAARRHRRAGRSCSPPSAQAFGLDRAAPPRRGLRQLAYHGHERGRRDDRRRPRRLHEDALPDVQHQVARS